MVHSWQNDRLNRIGAGPLSEIDSLEAPNRSFVGHRDIVTRSLARYHYVAPYVSGKLLDVGCGRGYGFEVLRPQTSGQTGVDISHEFLRETQHSYSTVALARTSGEQLPFQNGAFDTVISFEVIEHLNDDQAFLIELKRLVRPGGYVAISTPNRFVASGEQVQPLNPFHVREYTAPEFAQLLSTTFSSFVLVGQHERLETSRGVNRLIDRIPIGWKYLLPSHFQGVLSVALRPPLRIEECQFLADHLDQAHTLLAICSV